MFETHARAVSFRSTAVCAARALTGAALLLHTGCTPATELPDEPDQVLLSLAAVPADVACLRVTAEGKGRTVVKLVPLETPATPGAAAPEGGETGDVAVTKALGGLPLGTVVFTGEAFEKACDDVTASSIGGWISEAVTATLAAGRLSTVSLFLVRNGRAKVKVSFTDETACAAGACAAAGDAGTAGPG